MMACDQGRGDNLPPPSYGQVAGMSLSPRWRVPILSSPAATWGVMCLINRRCPGQLPPNGNWRRTCPPDALRVRTNRRAGRSCSYECCQSTNRAETQCDRATSEPRQAFIFSNAWKCESMTCSTCLLLLSLISGAVLPALAADGDVVFRSDVSLVRVDAQVVDRDNRTVTGLRAEDFILHDEGQPQRIGNFASENMPLDVVLLLDVSASMRPHVERIASAARQALQVLRNNDRVAIMVFDRSTRLRLPFRNSRDDVERELDSLLKEESFQGGTDITRGLLDAAEYVAREGRRDARRAIVILTDDQTEYQP